MPKLALVEDDSSIRRLFTMLIKAEGWEIDAFDHAAAASQHLAQQPVDAIILDVWLPDMSGVELAKQLRERGIDTPILLVTAGNVDQLREEVEAIPGAIIKDKWLTPDDLRQSLRGVLSNRSFT